MYYEQIRSSCASGNFAQCIFSVSGTSKLTKSKHVTLQTVWEALIKTNKRSKHVFPAWHIKNHIHGCVRIICGVTLHSLVNIKKVGGLRPNFKFVNICCFLHISMLDCGITCPFHLFWMARKHFYCQKRTKINVTSDVYLLNVNSPNSYANKMRNVCMECSIRNNLRSFNASKSNIKPFDI